MKTMRRFILLVFLGATGINLLNAQWVQTNGPYGGDILCFAVSPNGTGGSNLFAGTYGAGVFLSTHYGASWKAVNTDLSYYKDVSSLAVIPNDPGGNGTVWIMNADSSDKKQLTSGPSS